MWISTNQRSHYHITDCRCNVDCDNIVYYINMTGGNSIFAGEDREKKKEEKIRKKRPPPGFLLLQFQRET